MSVFVIAPLELDSVDAARLGALRKAHDPHAEIVKPHITLVFALDDGLETEAQRWSRIHAATFSAFALRLTVATVARDYENSAWYLFLMPHRIPPGLAELHRRLNSGALASAPDVPLDGHVTVGRFDERILAEAVARDANGEGIAIDTHIETLEVVRFDGTAVRSRVVLPLGE
ncbi:MAG TPA: 2'-5' RNA ligase family protein [Candidatus Cybelea sp.]|nr:2'-5' RNA ligase family protein [Candidatus Cybelea sp.]